MKVGDQLRWVWRQAIEFGSQGFKQKQEIEAASETERKTLALPAILSPLQYPGQLLPKPTPLNLRRFAETPIVRRAINVIKDRIAAMDYLYRLLLRDARQQAL